MVAGIRGAFARCARRVAALALPLALACGDAPRGAVDPEAPTDFTGHFSVEGSTETRGGGASRPIRGTVIIVHRAPDAPHVVSFSMQTVFATPEGPIEAEMIGSAEAETGDGELSGRAETQILMGTVPGIDPTFPFIPARLGPTIVSVFRMTPDPESAGSFRIEIESEATEESPRYEATHTTLRADRTAAVRGGGPSDPEAGGTDASG